MFPLRTIAFLLSSIAMANLLHAQCSLQQQMFVTPPGTNGRVLAVTEWDPDGNGPLVAKIVCGGIFTRAGGVQVENVAMFDPATSEWQPLGSLDSSVRTLAVIGQDLYAGGSFGAQGYVARWTGTTWQPVGGGVYGTVDDMIVTPTGDLLIGGVVFGAGTIVANGVMRWDGSNWSAVGLAPGAPTSLAQLPNGFVVACGSFGVAQWDGISWTSIGIPAGTVREVTVLSNGNLIAGGFFSTMSGVPANDIATWDGTSWSDVGGGINNSPIAFVNSIVEDLNGDLLVGGIFSTTTSAWSEPVARYDGQSWSAVGSDFAATAGGPRPEVFDVHISTYGTVIGGVFATASDVGVDNIALQNGPAWQALSLSTRPTIRAIQPIDNGTSILVGGEFTDIEGVACRGIARWDGQNWSPLGAGVATEAGKLSLVRAIKIADNGDTYVGGSFATAGTTPAFGVAKWDGNTWSALGAGLINHPAFPDPEVQDMVLLPNGDLVVTGFFGAAAGITVNGMARWDGTAWSAFGDGTIGAALKLEQLANGDVVAGGALQSASLQWDGVLRWDGSSWQHLGAGLSSTTSSPIVTALLTLRNGDLIAGGLFDLAGGMPTSNIARWNGNNWQTIGNGVPGQVSVLIELPNGDLLAGGGASWPPGSSTGMQRWNGSTWTQIGEGVVNTAAITNAGVLFASGLWNTPGSMQHLSLSSLETTCAALASTSGNGCVGSGGNNLLTATSSPWIGSTFTSEATGMPSNSLAIDVRGLTTLSTPLTNIHPAGQVGCDLLVSPDLLLLQVPTAGVAATSFTIPNSTTLVGQVLHQQVVPVELDAQGNIVALTSTNRLTLTIGAF